jgi:hypothetical protein
MITTAGIGESLETMYNSGVTSTGNAMIQSIIGVENQQTAEQILGSYYVSVAVGVGVGVAVGAAASIADIAVNGTEVEVIATTQTAAQEAALNETTEIKLVGAAKQAIKQVGAGKGPVYGTKVHTAFEKIVKGLGLKTEQSYLNGVPVKRGTPGSIRVDALEGSIEKPTVVYDLKTGSAELTQARIQKIQQHLPGGSNVPIIMIKAQ